MDTKIKICGLSRVQDVKEINKLKPDYIGFVFADFSHRYVTKEKAAELKKLLDPEIKAVGVFVNEEVDAVAELLKEGIIDIAQLHGSEDEDYISKLRSKTDAKIIKAFNINKIESLSEIENSSADLVLVDSGTGSGETFEWSKLKGIKRKYLLAGGLKPDNIAEAIGLLHPYGVDVSSGVETDKLKDPEKMQHFVSIVRGENTGIVRILKAERTDLKDILDLQYLAYQSEAALFKSKDIPPLKETLEEVMEEFEKGTVLKLIDGDEIIGSVRAYEAEGTVYIGKLMVHPDRQRKGCGRKLLAEIEKCYPGKRYELFTSTRSIDNITLYKKCGYEIYDNKVINDELEFVYLEKRGK